MLFVWLAVILPPTLVFGYVALSGLFLLLRSGLQKPLAAPLLVVLITISGYLLSFHEASRPIWKELGKFVTQILLQLGSIASASASSATVMEGHENNDWLGEGTKVLLPVIEKNAPLSHLIAVVLGVFMSSFVTSMTDSLKKRKIPEYM